MILKILLLFIAPYLGAFIARRQMSRISIDYSLIFSGAYLLTISITHLLPEVFHHGENSFKLGLFILAGFFLQQILELFSHGVEHGHVHEIKKSRGYTLLIGLFLHAFLEGTILIHPSELHHPEHTHSLVIGVFLHKIPAGFALFSVIMTTGCAIRRCWVYLFIFSLASPVGIMVSELLLHDQESWMPLLYALVSGSFLHISTTIFVESNPKHNLAFRKMIIASLGAGLAILMEMLL